MKIIYCGGGTSGHVSPAIAIKEAVDEYIGKHSALFIGREGGKENSAVIKARIPIKTVKVIGLKRNLSLESLSAIKMAIAAKKEAASIIKNFGPDLVIGTGGYVCWPVLKAAKSLGIKTILHESNAYPGLVVKLLSKKTDLTLLGIEDAKEELGKKAKTVYVGNPVRKGFDQANREKARNELGLRKNEILILSFGGSNGSARMNEIVIPFITKNKNRNIRYIHATGRNNFDPLYENSKGENVKIIPFFNNMEKILPAADLAITRSGAMTLSELSASGVGAILIPSPNVTADHQRKNAKAYEQKGAARVIDEEILSEKLLEKCIQEIIEDKEVLEKMRKNTAKLYNKDSKKLISEQIKELIQKAKST